MTGFNEAKREALLKAQAEHQQAQRNKDVRYLMMQHTLKKAGKTPEQLAAERNISVDQLLKEQKQKKSTGAGLKKDEAVSGDENAAKKPSWFKRFFSTTPQPEPSSPTVDDPSPISSSANTSSETKPVETFPMTQMRDEILKQCTFRLANMKIKDTLVTAIIIEFVPDMPATRIELVKAALESKRWGNAQDNDEKHPGYAPHQRADAKGNPRLFILGESRIGGLVSELEDKKITPAVDSKFQCSERLRAILGIHGIEVPSHESGKAQKI